MEIDSTTQRYSTILNIAEAVGQAIERNNIENNSLRKSILEKSETEYCLENSESYQALFNCLFPDGLIISTDFYLKLCEFNYLIGFEKNSNNLTANIWAFACKILSNEKAELLLKSLLKIKSHHFFTVLHMIPYFITEYELLPEFASTWFDLLSHQLGEDLAGGDLYIGIQNYCNKYPLSGDCICKLYSEKKIR